MANRTYYTFTLEDGIKGLTRALNDANITILDIKSDTTSSIFHIKYQGEPGEITLEETIAENHPLARLGRISALRVTFPDAWPSLEKVLTLAFLRGGG